MIKESVRLSYANVISNVSRMRTNILLDHEFPIFFFVQIHLELKNLRSNLRKKSQDVVFFYLKKNIRKSPCERLD